MGRNRNAAALAGLLTVLPMAAGAATYDFNVIALNQGEVTGSSDGASITDSGSVTYQDYYRDPPNGSASDNRHQIETATYDAGSRSWVYDESFDVGTERPFGYASPIGNSAGQTLVISNYNPSGGQVYQELAILEADGVTIRILGEQLFGGAPDRPDIPNFGGFDTSRTAINANGDVAAIVYSTNNRYQIVKFPADGSAPVVIIEVDGTTNGIFSIVNGIDINDSGTVVFTGTELGHANPLFTSTTGVYVSDGTTITRVVEGTDFVVNGRAVINNNGDVAVPVANGPGGQNGYLVQEAGAATATPTYLGVTGNSIPTGMNLNDYGQVAYELDDDLYIDDELVLENGGRIDGAAGTIQTGLRGIQLRDGFGFNNLGQAVIGLNLDADSPSTGQDTSAIVRVDPMGSTPDSALVPFASTPDGQNDIALNIVNGLGVIAPIYVDPVVATGFTYTQGAGGANFASLIIPGALPGGQSDFLLEFLYGPGSLFSGTISVGDVFDFTLWDALGIAGFTIRGIDVAELVDPTDPFIVGLTFVSGGFQSTLSIDAITVDTDIPPVPLPAGMLLLLSAIAGLGVLRRMTSAR